MADSEENPHVGRFRRKYGGDEGAASRGRGALRRALGGAGSRESRACARGNSARSSKCGRRRCPIVCSRCSGWSSRTRRSRRCRPSRSIARSSARSKTRWPISSRSATSKRISNARSTPRCSLAPSRVSARSQIRGAARRSRPRNAGDAAQARRSRARSTGASSTRPRLTCCGRARWARSSARKSAIRALIAKTGLAVSAACHFVRTARGRQDDGRAAGARTRQGPAACAVCRRCSVRRSQRNDAALRSSRNDEPAVGQRARPDLSGFAARVRRGRHPRAQAGPGHPGTRRRAVHR